MIERSWLQVEDGLNGAETGDRPVISYSRARPEVIGSCMKLSGSGNYVENNGKKASGFKAVSCD